MRCGARPNQQLMDVVNLDRVTFVRQGTLILSEFSWNFNAGEHWAIIGPNGAGKTTLVALISGYAWPTTGTLRTLGATHGRVNLPEHRKQIGIFQPALQSGLDIYHPGITALEIIETGANASLANYAEPSLEVRARAQALFDRHFLKKGVGGFPSGRPFRLLSAGERRKVLLLRGLMARPGLLILDEPYESLDIPARLELEKILVNHVAAVHLPTVTIVHRIEEVPPFVTHALLVKNGRVFRAGPVADMVQSATLSDLFDTGLEIGRRGTRYYCIPIDS